MARKTVQINSDLYSMVLVVKAATDETVTEIVETAIREYLENKLTPKDGQSIFKSGGLELHVRNTG